MHLAPINRERLIDSTISRFLSRGTMHRAPTAVNIP